VRRAKIETKKRVNQLARLFIGRLFIPFPDQVQFTGQLPPVSL
jgi:hypothetical protein